MCMRHRTQNHLPGMAGYSVGMSDIYLLEYTFAFMSTLIFMRCVASKIVRSKPKIKEENEALE